MATLRNFETRVFRKLRREPPQSKLHRLAFWFFIIYLVQDVLRFIPGAAGQFFAATGLFTLLILLGLCIPLAWRWIFKSALWKVRNRLVVTYLLMGLAPVILFVTLALIALYVFCGQFAIFAATAQIQSELAHISSENRTFATHLAHAEVSPADKLGIALPEAVEADHVHPGLKVQALRDGKPLTLSPSILNSDNPEPLPAWLNRPFSGVVVEQGHFYLCAVDLHSGEGHTVVSVSTVPLTRSIVDLVAHGLGRVTIIDPVQDSGKPHPKVPIRSEDDGHDVDIDGHDIDVAATQRHSIQGGHLVPGEHFYDVPVTFYSPFTALEWSNGSQHTTFMYVSSRPSLLYQRLFSSSLSTGMITSLKSGAIIRDILIGIAIFFGILELFAFVMAVRLNRTITESIRGLYQATLAIDRGDFAHRIEVTRRDQLAALGTSFNNMASSLERLLEEQREKERLQNELAIAQEVQANLFPRASISLPNLELHGVCYPARSVSGDYYDFLLFGPTGLGIALGDISGKGISAALLMATLHSAVRAYRFAGEELVHAAAPGIATISSTHVADDPEECGELFEEPAHILGLLNRHIYRSTQPEKYATLFLAHYDGAKRKLIYSNGGQLPPLLLRSDDSVTRLDCGGTVVGLIDNMSYQQGIEELHKGDILIAYSDGVTEPENEFGEFGEERMLEVVRRNRHLPLDAISEQVMQALRTWIGGQEQPDDITLVLARQL
ncbi:PP2C family protein-serine/threonine phosphatase [Silvibacterium acidisoli]|uniref:PP2C family protein-serine/threonine phosphatase n=1 Tax=Acidobacteriaceae bacterium ZG23-2 TaxID=2883246 RepID=UPI00406C6BA4